MTEPFRNISLKDGDMETFSTTKSWMSFSSGLNKENQSKKMGIQIDCIKLCQR